MLTIQQIITEVDALVPNTFDVARKLTWINGINKEFFEVVKMPTVATLTVAQIGQTLVPSDLRSYNMIRVLLNNTYYKSMQYEQVNPGHNYWTFDDVTKIIKFEPNPLPDTQIFLTYYKSSKKTFLIAAVNTDVPEAPEEYHWAYVLGLSERVAKAMNDVSLANNYGNDYMTQLNIAQQNYNPQKEG